MLFASRFVFIFMSFLLSAQGDENFPTNNIGYDRLSFLISTFKQKCLDHPNPLSCEWDTTTEFDSPKPINEPFPDKDTSEESTEEETSLETPFITSENNLNKRFSVFRRKSPIIRGYKRGPGFRSWGGKRDFWPTEEKKSKFQNWGGKRTPNENWGQIEKRDKEIPDKRGQIFKNRYFYFTEPFKNVPKRPQFQSWGGKRSEYPWGQFIQPQLSFNGDEKRKFSSWGGKRMESDNLSHEAMKRHAFRNWGGKRMTPNQDSNENEPKSSTDWDKEGLQSVLEGTNTR